MLNAYNADLGNVQKALAVIRTAPANVQSAFKNLLSFVKQIRTDIQNASSLQGLVASFATLGKNTQLETDGTTIANWYAGVCGGTLVSHDHGERPVANRSTCRPPVPERPPQLRVPRPDESVPLDEIAMARGWLQHLRESAIFKVEGLDAAQLRWRPSPTANSLGVLVVHLGYSERLWLRAISAGEQMDMGWRARNVRAPGGVGRW